MTDRLDDRTEAIISKYSLSDVVPRASDFEAARANLLPLDGSTPVFVGGRLIARRRQSSSPAVEEALARGFELAHFPSRALLPHPSEDSFGVAAAVSKSGAPVVAARRPLQSTSRVRGAAATSVSPEPALPRADHADRRSPSLAATSSWSDTAAAAAARAADEARIPKGISPHVLPQGLLMRPLPSAGELLASETPLQHEPTARLSDESRRWRAGADMGFWATSDASFLADLSRPFRRCYPRTEKDEQLDEYPTSQFAGNFILRRYGGNFPPHCQYDFYKKYGERGLGARSSEYHSFPGGRHPLAPL